MISSIIASVMLCAASADQSLGIEDLLKSGAQSGTGRPVLMGQNQVPSVHTEASGDSSLGALLGSQGGDEAMHSDTSNSGGDMSASQAKNLKMLSRGSQNSANVGANPLMAALMESAGQPNGAAKKQPGISLESKDIVAGIIEAFMHKQHLLPGERSCLENSLSTITMDVVGTAKDLIDAIKSLIPQPAGQYGQSGQFGQQGAQHGVNSGSLMSDGLDGAMKITSLVTLSTTLVKSCVHGDALRMLNETAHHLIDLKYIGHRFVVSGVDVAHSLADSIISYESHHYHRFGNDIGTALRKVLLSKSTHGAKLPEGVPEETIIQEATEGIMDGFFVGGSEVEITDAVRPDVDIRLDLHRCIAGNQPFFKEIFLALWSGIAQLSLNGEQHGFMPHGGNTGNQQWTGELMVALMQLPVALQRCNVDSETEHMLMEAIQTLPSLKFHIEFPARKAKMDEITERMAKAVELWTQWDFKEFGEQLGKMLREFVLFVLPMKYSVDANGRLRRKLLAPRNGLGERVAPTALVIGGISFSLFLGLAAVRGFRAAREGTPVTESDVEWTNSNEILTEELVE